MKKLILPVILILLLSSCGKTARCDFCPAISPNSVFTVEFSGCEYTARLNTDEALKLTAEIISPEAIKGLIVECGKDGIGARCGDVEVNYPDGCLPFAFLHKVICFINENEPISVQKDASGFTFVYNDGGEDYTVKTDALGEIYNISTPVCTFKR